MVTSFQADNITYQLFNMLTTDQVRITYSDHKPNHAELLAAHAKTYGPFIPPFPWHEVLLGFSKPTTAIDPSNIELIASSCYHHRKVLADKANDFTVIVITGLIETSHKQFIYGIRDGNVKSNKACIAPAGKLSDTFRGRNILWNAFYNELTEELGLGPADVDDPRIIGTHTDPDSKGLNFVFYAKTPATFADIQQMHELAMLPYLIAKQNGVQEADARDAIKQAGFLNVDAWEHIAKIPVSTNPRTIDDIIARRALPHNEHSVGLLDGGRMPLIILRASNIHN